MNKSLRQDVDELLYLMIENAATPEQAERLNSLIAASLELQQYAADYYFMAAALHKSNTIASASLGTEYEANELYNLLEEMAKEEKTAPILEIEPQREVQKKTFRKIEVIRPVRRINRLSLGITIASLAAFLFLLAYVRMIPPRESVAVLKDSIAAQWQGTQEDIQSGFWFYNTDTPRLLKKGILQIEFDYGATVVIEGPSEFVCKSANQIAMNYGRLYARVPSQATGFTVETLNARIVDVGTEFGVQANIDGTTELHVLKGLTKLLTRKGNEAFSITEGQARVVSSDGVSVKEAVPKENSFVQQINSTTGLIRKGQKYVDLADIAGGGNGFGTGRRDMGLDPVTGEMTRVSEKNRKSDNAFHRVRSNPFIDGVFVPNGPEQIINSLGLTFNACPQTQGGYFAEISNSPVQIDQTALSLGGVNYSTSDSSCLFMHANLGITYDLKAIRSQLEGVNVTRFKSTIGISDTSMRATNAVFWVLVDGKVRYRKENTLKKGIADVINIELSEKDRFLTLMTTDGGDQDTQMPDGTIITSSIGWDWCIFGKPVLALE